MSSTYYLIISCLIWMNGYFTLPISGSGQSFGIYNHPTYMQTHNYAESPKLQQDSVPLPQDIESVPNYLDYHSGPNTDFSIKWLNVPDSGKFVVYDRYGQVCYETDNPTINWQGNSKLGMLKQEVYIACVKWWKEKEEDTFCWNFSVLL